eukprot:764575-Hanusia_phi.AAC.1
MMRNERWRQRARICEKEKDNLEGAKERRRGRGGERGERGEGEIRGGEGGGRNGRGLKTSLQVLRGLLGKGTVALYSHTKHRLDMADQEFFAELSANKLIYTEVVRKSPAAHVLRSVSRSSSLSTPILSTFILFTKSSEVYSFIHTTEPTSASHAVQSPRKTSAAAVMLQIRPHVEEERILDGGEKPRKSRTGLHVHIARLVLADLELRVMVPTSGVRCLHRLLKQLELGLGHWLGPGGKFLRRGRLRSKG